MKGLTIHVWRINIANNLASFEPLYKAGDASTISPLTATNGALNLQSGDL